MLRRLNFLLLIMLCFGFTGNVLAQAELLTTISKASLQDQLDKRIGPKHTHLAIPLERREDAYQLNIPLDHGAYFENGLLHLHATPRDIAYLDRNEVTYSVTTDQRNHESEQQAVDDRCNQEARFPIVAPRNFTLGSLANGYYSIQDTWDAFAQMKISFPDLISQEMIAEPFRTFEGRPLRYWRISDNPNQEENEPRVLLNSLHHAREPASLVQLVYFTWWILENYSTDPQAKWLLDNTELYILPIVNPDGYAFNGGDNSLNGDLGFWRKNRRDNGDGTFGVDLNRNYSFGWGGPGSSDETDSDIYRGPSPLSEPETQALDSLIRRYGFTTILNNHSFSDLVITLDPGQSGSDAFDRAQAELSWAMRRDNRYAVGGSLETVGYVASGNSDDHFALETSNNKPIAISMTPEVGSAFFGFLPPENELSSFLTDMVLVNWRAIQSAHFTPVVEIENGSLRQFGELRLRIANASRVSGTAQLKVSSPNDAVIFFPETFDISLGEGEYNLFDVGYQVLNAPQGTPLEITVEVTNLQHIKPLTVNNLKIYQETILLDEGFTQGTNVFNETTFATGNADHPNAIGFMGDRTFGFETTIAVPSSAELLEVEYTHQFGTASRFEQMQVGISKSGQQTELSCSRHTSEDLLIDSPAFWGTTPTFIKDRFTYEPQGAGDYVLLWNLSPGLESFERYAVDDITVKALSAIGVSSNQNLEEDAIRILPNPTPGLVTINGAQYGDEVAIYTAEGRMIRSSKINTNQLDLQDLPVGFYHIQINTSGSVSNHKLVITR